MSAPRILAPQPWWLRRVRQVFRSGGLLAYPTEAVFGLGCDPWNAQAVDRLLELKMRAPEKGLILIGAEFEQLAPFLGALARPALQRALDTWPGPATWLLPANPGTPRWLCGNHPTLAVRVTAHPVARAMCQTCRSALVSTSANPGGRAPARDALHVRRYFHQAIDCIVPGRVGGLPRPTPIRDARSGACVRV